MTTYYLQQWAKDGRWIIDATFPQNAYRVADSRDADCWIAAKKAFGYALSSTQEYLLDQFRIEKQKAA